MSFRSCATWILTASCSVSAGGCVPYCSTFRHLDFTQVRGATVVESGVLDLNGLLGVEPFPLAYAIKRDGYQLNLKAGQAHLATARVSIVSNRSLRLKLLSVHPVSPKQFGCYSNDESPDGLTIRWISAEGCGTTGTIRVAVSDETGEEVAIEELRFDAVPNGHFCITDAL